MVVALFALSLVMVVGGIAAVIQGFPYVRLESGLALVIGGATAASAGAILLGLSAVVLRLKRIDEALRDGSASAVGGRPALPAPPPAPAPDFGAPPAVEPGMAHDRLPVAGLAGLAGLGIGAAGFGADRRGMEPVFEDTPPPAASQDASAGEAESVEPLLPNLLPAAEEMPPAAAPPEPEPAPEAPSAAPPQEDLFVPSAADNDGGLALRPALDDDASTAASTQEPAPVDEPQVVGTYSSGGNTYVMYSTGLIEADTPNGRFTFNSLDELKAFVDSGGETQARGAA